MTRGFIFHKKGGGPFSIYTTLVLFQFWQFVPHINQNRYSLFKEGWYYNNALQFINERIMKIPFVLISSSDCSSRSSFEPNEKNKTRSSIWFFKYQVKLFQLLEPDVMNIFPVLKPIRQDTSWIQYNQIRPVSYHFLDVLFKKLFVIQLFSYSARAIETILNLRILMRDDKSVMPKKSEKNFNEKLLF